MENQSIKQKFKFKDNNSFIYINNTPKMLRLSATPVITNLSKKNIHINKNNNNNNDKFLFKKKPYINFNFNLIQNKNMNNKRIRTITPNLKLREIVNQKIRENNIHNFNNIKCKTELPDIFNINPNHNKSYIHTDYNIKKKETNDNMDRQLKLIFVMKNKINELNKIIREKDQEIYNLKNGEIIYGSINTINKEKNINNNNNISENKNISDNSDNKKEYKNISRDKNLNNIKNENNRFKKIKKENKDFKDNNKLGPITKKYNETLANNMKEIQNLKKMINGLEEKYQQELKKNKDITQKYSYIRNSTIGFNSSLMQNQQKMKDKEKIIELEEQINQYKIRDQNKKKLRVTKTELKIISSDIKNKEKVILTDDEYSNIQICLNALIKINQINEENIKKGIKEMTFSNINIIKITNNICNLLKISNSSLISNFINDYLIKNNKNNLYNFSFKELNKYDISNSDNINYNLNSFLKERCITYDYKKKKKISIYYLRHIYQEFCFKNNKLNNEKEFFNIVYTCKKNNYSSNIYDIFYDNLITHDENDDKINEKMVKNFIDSLMNEELEKYMEEQKEKEKLEDMSKQKKNNKKFDFSPLNSEMNDNINYINDDDLTI